MVLLCLLVATYILGIAILLISAIAGYKRGMFGSLLRTVYIIVISAISGVVAYFVSHNITHSLINLINNPTAVALMEATPETVQMIEVMVTPIVFSIIWTILFGLLELISMIKFNSVSEWVETKTTHHTPQHDKKTIGTIVGVCNGVISSAILLIPLCFVVSILNTAELSVLQELNIPVDHQYEYAARTPSDALLKLTTSVHDNHIPEEYAGLCKTGLNMKDEAPCLLNAVGHAKTAYDEAKSHHMSQRETLCLEIGAINSMSQNDSHVSSTMPYIFANVIHLAADTWSHGDAFLGIQLPTDNQMTKALISNMLDILKNVTPENATSVVNTLMGDGHEVGVINNFLELQSQSSSYDNMGDMIKENDELVADTLIKLGKSEDLHTINNVVNEMGQEYIQSASEKLFDNETISNEQKKETLNKLTDSVSSFANKTETEETAGAQENTTTYEEQIDSISSEVMSMANEYNYSMSSAEATIIAVGLSSYFESTDEVTTEGLMKYFGFSAEEIDSIMNGQ